jgi:hypothetical protein
MTEVVFPSIPWQPFVAALLIFGVFPGAVLRLVALLYPKDHPRRNELIGELYAVPYRERPLFVAQQFETALNEGLPTRVRLGVRSIIRWTRTRAERRVGARAKSKLLRAYLNAVDASFTVITDDTVDKIFISHHSATGPVELEFPSTDELSALMTARDPGSAKLSIGARWELRRLCRYRSAQPRS